jgi:hypothetical protein
LQRASYSVLEAARHLARLAKANNDVPLDCIFVIEKAIKKSLFAPRRSFAATADELRAEIIRRPGELTSAGQIENATSIRRRECNTICVLGLARKSAAVSSRLMKTTGQAEALLRGIFDNIQRPLTRSPLSMKDSADAIKSVVHCVRAHPFSSQRAQNLLETPPSLVLAFLLHPILSRIVATPSRYDTQIESHTARQYREKIPQMTSHFCKRKWQVTRSRPFTF